MKKVSIVVPCYNEEKAIKIFYDEINPIINNIEDCSFEIIFVNDGSKDNTVKVIKELRETDEKIGLVNFTRNFGKEAALLAGMDNAVGDAVIVMDVDLQDPPSLLPELIDSWRSGCDIVYTRRVNRDGEPPIRSFFARLFYKMINKLSEVEIVDGARDYRIMGRHVVDSLLSLREKNRFSKGLFMWVGYESKVIEFEHADRSAGETKWSFAKLFGYAIEGVVSFSNFPLRIASFMGVFISLGAFLFMLYIVIKTILLNNSVSGWASMTSIILFLGGIQLIVIGVIGEYLGRIFNEVKNRPIYLVKELCESTLKKEISKEQC